MRTGATQLLLLRIEWLFVRHKVNRGESMIHKPPRLAACV